MKFGKTAPAAFLAIGAPVPAFPYKQLKKQLKDVVKGGKQEPFFRNLLQEMRRIDYAWQIECKNVLFAAGSPRAASVVAALSLKSRPTKAEVKARAISLDQWAALSREGLRKLLKKYRKLCSERFPEMPAAASRFSGLAFMRGCLRTQIEGLAVTDGADASAEPAADEPDERLDCPVCLERLYQPVASAQCGHALCAPCFKQLKAADPQRAAPPCPVCRTPVRSAKPLAVLGSIVKATHPTTFRARAEAEAEATRAAQDAALAKRFAGRANAHPMAMLLAN